MSDKITGNNPWKAFLPYDEESAPQFKGRTRNIEELFAFVERERTTVCYADSGVGKSSLINAGLKPKLRQHLFFPVDIVFTETDYASGGFDFDRRVIQELEKEIAKRNEQNEEVKFQLRRSIGTSDEKVEALDKKLADSSLWWLLHTRKIECFIMGNHVADYSPIFIFDQFEELFTRSQHEQLIQSFFEWYPTASSDSISSAVEKEVEGLDDDALFFKLPKMTSAKFLFSLRQDSMGTLDYWVTQRFSILSLRSNRYCLLPLTTEQAHSVITEQGVDTLNGVADEIIQELKETNNDSVPAIMLSVFCNRLYEKARIGADGKKIPVEREEISTNKERLIREYYEELLAKTGIDENAVYIIEDCLVSDTGKRNRVVNGSSESLEEIRFDEKYRKLLSDCYLINDKGEYIEIAHDKVAEAIFVRKKERKLKKNLRKWKVFVLLIPVSLLVFTVLYMVLPSNVVQYSWHEFILDDNEYLDPNNVNGDRIYLVNPSPVNNSLYQAVKIDSLNYCWDYFSNCPNLQRVKVEKKQVGRGFGGQLSFRNCPKLECVNLAECVNRIEEEFIVNCPNLKTFRIPKSVEYIDQQAFLIDNLSFEVDSLNEYFVWENGILWNKSSNSTPIVYIQEDILRKTNKVPFLYRAKHQDSIRYRDMYVYPLDLHNAEIFANRDSSKLYPSPTYKFYKSIDLSRYSKVEEIPDELFAECIDLESVVLPPFVKKIGRESFRSCRSLKEVIFPASLYEIGEKSFEDCRSLTCIKFKGDKSIDISDYAFSSCLSLDTLELPFKIYILGESAFSDCANLRKVILPDTVRIVRRNVFDRCFCLKTFRTRGEKMVIRENCVIRRSDSTFLWAINTPINYKDEHYYSENGILYHNEDIVAWNEFSQFNKLSYSDSFHNVGEGRYRRLLIVDDLDKKTIYLPLCLDQYVNYSFWKLPLKLKELHIPHPQPDGLSRIFKKSDRAIAKSELFVQTVRIELPQYIKENVILYVPYGCSKYYQNHPDYQGFKAIVEDVWWMRVWNVFVFVGSVSSFDWLGGIVGIIILCCFVYVLGRSIDYAIGIKSDNRKSIISAINFTVVFTPIVYIGGLFFVYFVFTQNSKISSTFSSVFCFLSVMFLSTMQRVTPKELWKIRNDIGAYLCKYIKSKVLLLVGFILYLFYFML